MYVLICYDVNTQTAKGRRRLRKAAQACQDYGQRVQLSVFECSVNEVQLELLRARLLDVIDQAEDSLRIYRLPGTRESIVEAYGSDKYEDLEGPLVL